MIGFFTGLLVGFFFGVYVCMADDGPKSTVVETPDEDPRS